MRAIVIGGGVGGLTAGIRLATSGFDVTLFERAPHVGGQVSTLSEEGWSFDLGPSVLTLPHVWDEVLGLAGTALADEVELVVLDPQVRYQWPNGTTLVVPDDDAAFGRELDRFSPGAGAQWAAFIRRAADIWTASEQTLLAGPVEPSRLGLRRSSIDLARIEGHRPLAKLAADHFDDPRLLQLVGRYATTAGSSPFQAPATLASVAYVERAFGCWYPVGGFGRVLDALERAARSVGVDIRTRADVGRVVHDGGRVTGVELADGGTQAAEVVVSGVDAAHLFSDLVPDPRQAKQLDKLGRSASAFVVCAAVRGRTEGIEHRNVYFSFHDRQEFKYLEAGQMPIDQTIAATVSSVTDAGRAPVDGENWCIRVDTPSAIGIDRKLMTAAVLNRLAERGIDLRQRIDYTRTLVPADFEARYRVLDGSLYGASSNGKRAAVSRPSNRGPIDGLYLVGGTAHPGGTLPMVAISARIVADLVAERHS